MRSRGIRFQGYRVLQVFGNEMLEFLGLGAVCRTQTPLKGTLGG